MFNTYYLTVNFKTAGAVLKGEVQKLKKYLEELDDSAMQKLVIGFNCGKVEAGEFGELDASLFVKNSKPKKEYVLANENDLTVVIDTTLTQELIDEGASLLPKNNGTSVIFSCYSTTDRARLQR